MYRLIFTVVILLMAVFIKLTAYILLKSTSEGSPKKSILYYPVTFFTALGLLLLAAVHRNTK